MLKSALLITIVFSHFLVLSQKKTTTFPFSIVENKNIVSVNIEGQDSLLFVFDSGAALTAIDSATAVELGFKPQKRIISGIYTEYFIPEVEIALSSFSLGKVEAKVSEISKDLSVNGISISGAIGSDIFNKYITEVNYDNMLITLWDKFPKGRKTISLGQHPIFASINCTIELSNGTTITGDFLIDSGAPVTLIFNTPFVEKHNLTNGCKADTKVNVQNSGRKFKTLYGEVASVDFCNHLFHDVPVILSQSNSGFLSISRYAGLMGNEILRRFNIIWDYPNNKLSLNPSKFYNDEMPEIK